MDTNKVKTISAYDKIADEFSQRNADPFWTDEGDYFVERLSGKKIIELGCGAGRDAELLVNAGLDYVGIDLSQQMLALARRRLPTAIFLQGDFYQLDYPNQAFDGLWAVASFLHAPKADIDAVLTEARRVLKKNGIAFIAIKKKKKIDEGLIHSEKAGGIDRYFSFYDPDEFAGILEHNGFRVIRQIEKPEREQDGSVTDWLGFFVSVS